MITSQADFRGARRGSAPLNVTFALLEKLLIKFLTTF